MGAKVDSELLRQLEHADGPIQAVVQLAVMQTSDALSPENIEQLAREVLQRATTEVGHSATRVNILRNIGTIILEAPADFVLALIGQPEIVTARPNQTSENLFIPPKGRRPA